MNYANIKYCDISNGAGVRTSLFVSGCRRHCVDCFNAEAWDFAFGKPFDERTQREVLDSLNPAYIAGLSLLGGEPMEAENQAGLVDFLERVRREYPDKTIWCYTGDLYEDLVAGGQFHTANTDRVLACVDVLVDGAFVAPQKDISLRFKGSSNQRILDLAAMRGRDAETGSVSMEPIYWDDGKTYSSHVWSGATPRGAHS